MRFNLAIHTQTILKRKRNTNLPVHKCIFYLHHLGIFKRDRFVAKLHFFLRAKKCSDICEKLLWTDFLLYLVQGYVHCKAVP